MHQVPSYYYGIIQPREADFSGVGLYEYGGGGPLEGEQDPRAVMYHYRKAAYLRGLGRGTCPTPGMKIGSAGQGRGLARGQAMSSLGQDSRETTRKVVKYLKWFGIITGIVVVGAGLYMHSKGDLKL